jgi:hypothetical protein
LLIRIAPSKPCSAWMLWGRFPPAKSVKLLSACCLAPFTLIPAYFLWSFRLHSGKQLSAARSAARDPAVSPKPGSARCGIATDYSRGGAPALTKSEKVHFQASQWIGYQRGLRWRTASTRSANNAERGYVWYGGGGHRTGPARFAGLGRVPKDVAPDNTMRASLRTA